MFSIFSFLYAIKSLLISLNFSFITVMPELLPVTYPRFCSLISCPDTWCTSQTSSKIIPFVVGFMRSVCVYAHTFQDTKVLSLAVFVALLCPLLSTPLSRPSVPFNKDANEHNHNQHPLILFLQNTSGMESQNLVDDLSPKKTTVLKVGEKSYQGDACYIAYFVYIGILRLLQTSAPSVHLPKQTFSLTVASVLVRITVPQTCSEISVEYRRYCIIHTRMQMQYLCRHSLFRSASSFISVVNNNGKHSISALLLIDAI